MNTKFSELSILSPTGIFNKNTIGKSYFNLGTGLDFKLAFIDSNMEISMPSLWFFFFSRDISTTLLETIENGKY